MIAFQSVPRELGELTALHQWVLWRLKPRDEGKSTKVPYRLDGYPASAANPETWASFNAVCQRYASGQGQYSGIGFVFREGGGFVGIDLDHVIGESGDTPPWVQRAIAAFNSYTEYSVSGQGLHILCKGSISDGKGHRREQVEMYDRGRYFTVSGRVYGEPRPLRGAQREIEQILEWVKHVEAEPKPQKQKPRVPACPDDRHLLHRAASSRNGYKFARLWQGDTSDYGGDDSRADIALLSMLMFWTNGNEARGDALFRQSGLNRPKWERREDYRKRCFGFLARG
jgi:putative DNA primase/helicase